MVVFVLHLQEILGQCFNIFLKLQQLFLKSQIILRKWRSKINLINIDQFHAWKIREFVDIQNLQSKLVFF